MTYYIGIDGGGTKTAFSLVDEKGNEKSACTFGSASYKQIGADGVIRMLKEGITTLFRSAAVQPGTDVAICFGMPNFGESVRQDERMTEETALAFPGMSIHLVNDAEAGWAGSLLLEAGINVVAGTGSIAYGRNRAGKAMSAGGWNEWFSDEGSCKWLGLRCMELFAKEADGRMEKGPLYQLVREHFALQRDIDIIDLFERDYQPYRDRIASLQKILSKAAAEGDRAAVRAYEAAAEELAILLKTLYRRLDFETECSVSYSGGLFRNGERILNPLKERLKEYPMKFVKPHCSPALGAVLLAKEYEDGKKPEESFIRAVAQNEEGRQ